MKKCHVKLPEWILNIYCGHQSRGGIFLSFDITIALLCIDSRGTYATHRLYMTFLPALADYVPIFSLTTKIYGGRDKPWN